MFAIESATIGGSAAGLAVVAMAGFALIRRGRRQNSGSRRDQGAGWGVSGIPQVRPHAGPATFERPNPLIAPGPTVHAADAAVIDLRVSFDDSALPSPATLSPRSVAPVRPEAGSIDLRLSPNDRRLAGQPGRVLEIDVGNADVRPLVRALSVELSRVGYYLREEPALPEHWFACVVNRSQQAAGTLTARIVSPGRSQLGLSIASDDRLPAVVDRALASAGFAAISYRSAVAHSIAEYASTTERRVMVRIHEPVATN
ncbi:MAG: hypothetical protein R2706_17585 [Acidimicrobiales bacterium]